MVSDYMHGTKGRDVSKQVAAVIVTSAIGGLGAVGGAIGGLFTGGPVGAAAGAVSGAKYGALLGFGVSMPGVAEAKHPKPKIRQ